MLKAELGDFLYIIIFAVLMLFGVLEKAAKAKRQQQQQPRRPLPDDFGDVEQSSPPQTIEDVLRRMMQPTETPEREKVVSCPEEAQPLEVIPTAGRYFYRPEEPQIREPSGIKAFSPSPAEMIKETDEQYEFEFDIRQAVIASEILNRRY